MEMIFCSFISANNLIASDISKAITTDANASLLMYSTIFSEDNSDSTKATTAIAWVNGFPAALSSTPDYRLDSSSIAATGASFTDNKFGNMVAGITGGENKISGINLYPNPITNEATVDVNLNEASKIAITV